MENYLTLSAVADELKVTDEAVRQLCHRGTMPFVRHAGRLLVHRADLDRFKKARKIRRAKK